MGALKKIKPIRKLKKIRIHHEGTSTLIGGFAFLLVLNGLCLYLLGLSIPTYIILGISVVLYGILVNFFRCPIRFFEGDTKNVVVAPADGKVVVIEEVEENEYFHERRIMVSIFMSLTNVHANWFPVDGIVRSVKHFNGNYHLAWLPKASVENEHADIIIDTPNHGPILVRQIAGAAARRIVTYAHEGDDCYIDEHIGFIKLGSRVDVYLPLGTEICVKMGQSTVGNNTIIARLHNEVDPVSAQ